MDPFNLSDAQLIAVLERQKVAAEASLEEVDLQLRVKLSKVISLEEKNAELRSLLSAGVDLREHQQISDLLSTVLERLLQVQQTLQDTAKERQETEAHSKQIQEACSKMEVELQTLKKREQIKQSGSYFQMYSRKSKGL